MISRYIFEVYGVLREQMGEGEEGTLSQQSILDQLFHSETFWSRCGNCCSSMEAMCAI